MADAPPAWREVVNIDEHGPRRIRLQLVYEFPGVVTDTIEVGCPSDLAAPRDDPPRKRSRAPDLRPQRRGIPLGGARRTAPGRATSPASSDAGSVGANCWPRPALARWDLPVKKPPSSPTDTAA